MQACPPGSGARLAAIRQLLLDETLAPGDRLADCLVVLYGQQPSKIVALRTTDTSCADGTTRLKLGADWLDVPEHVAAPLRQHLRDRSNMTRSQPGLAVTVSRAARRRTSQLPSARPRPSPTGHPRPGKPAGRLARTRPRGTARGPRRRAGSLARHSDAPCVPRRRRLVRLRGAPACSHPGWVGTSNVRWRLPATAGKQRPARSWDVTIREARRLLSADTARDLGRALKVMAPRPNPYSAGALEVSGLALQADWRDLGGCVMALTRSRARRALRPGTRHGEQ